LSELLANKEKTMVRTLFFKAGIFQNLLVIMFTLIFIGIAADVMAWQRNVSRTGPGGQTASRNITANRTDSGFDKSTQATGARGNSATRSSQGQWDAATQSWSKNVTTIGANGQTATHSSTATRVDDGYSKTTTATGPQGNTVTRSAQGQWDPETKTWTKSVTTTGGK
jgi:hypothetical protein